MAEALPCPFCGTKPDLEDDRTFQDSQGMKWGALVCCCTGPEVRTGYQPVEKWRDDAIEAWNTRAEPSPERIQAAVQHALHVTIGGAYRWHEYMRDLWRIMSGAAPPTDGRGR